MPLGKNTSNGPRGAWRGATLVMAEPGEVIEADDFPEDWFEVVGKGSEAEPEPESAEVAKHPLDHDGDGKPGGSLPRRRKSATKE